MDIDYTPIYIGIGVGAGALLAWKFRKTEPLMEISDAVYQKDEQKLRIHVTNRTPHPVFAKPAVRKIVENEEDDVSPLMSFMPANRDTQRTLYELISECDGPVEIPANSSVDLIFHLDSDPEFKTSDYLHVNSVCGVNPKEMKASVFKTLPMSIKESEVVAATVQPKFDSKKIIKQVKKLDSPEPALEPHPHLKNLIETIGVELKPLHGLILHFLELEGQLTAKDLSETLQVPKTTISKNLKQLYDNNLLHRIKDGRGFKYISLTYAISPGA